MQPFKVKAVYDYSSPHDDDLSFNEGQIITVTDQEDADWYYGEYNDSAGGLKQGLFPCNFVERHEPVTPPRPARSVKKDPAPPAVPAVPIESEPSTKPAQQDEEPESEDEEPQKEQVISPPPQRAVQEESVPESKRVSQAKSPEPAPLPPVATKPPPPPREPSKEAAASEKPAVGNSFRDRIAAFNKPAAPPVAPKPSGISGGGGHGNFVKKTYMAPPPSRNAYVPPAREPPPQKVYRREESMERNAQEEPEVEVARLAPAVPDTEETEDQPKPTSLKERIALLQKQQLEQAQKHTEAAQKKEKPKRPQKKRTESHQTDPGDPEVVAAEEGQEKSRGILEETEDDDREEERPSRRRTKSRESVPSAVPSGAPRELLSDTNDADQSAGADTEDGTEIPRPTAREPPLPPRSAQPLSPSAEAPIEDVSDEEKSEEDEMDAETRRRMEIRARMAKMSGGMGMAGMFGPPGGMPTMSKKSRASGDSEMKRSESHEIETTQASTAPPIPVMPGMALPGMSTVRSPEPAEKQLEPSNEVDPARRPSAYDSDEESVHDVEEIEKHVPTARKSEDSSRRVPPLPPATQDRPVPPPPDVPRAAPPVPTERPVPPPPPVDSRPNPPPVPSREQIASADSGSESDDELPEKRPLVIDTDARDTGPPPVPSTRPQGPRSPTNKRLSRDISSPIDSEAPSPSAKRASRVPPPIPGGIPMPGLPAARAPPPPPPTSAPPSRKPTEQSQIAGSDSEEVTEYDGDYDTDIAPGDTHKDALKATSSTEETLTGDETSFHHGGLPSLGPPSGPPPVPGSVPRGAPPPLPSQPPKQARQSVDMPRGAPPPPPPKGEEDGEYDPYNYTSPKTSDASNFETVVTPRAEDTTFDDDLYSRSPPREAERPAASTQSSYSSQAPPLPPPGPPQIPAPVPMEAPRGVPPPAPAHTPLTPNPQSPPTVSPMIPRGSLDVPRASTGRRSMDAQRQSMDGGFIADDVDLGRNTQWWTQRKTPPPVFQNRNDVWIEVDETSHQQKDGSELIVKQVRALFMDYSQTIVSARFDTRDAAHADFQQHHEAPPPRLRQDQLESAHEVFGARIAQIAETKLNSLVGNGTPFALVLELLSQFPDVVPPVGTRAYGAQVYVNLANATVQQHDEIRAGDIVSFRNAKLAGHRGGLKQKYAMDVGKPDHVGIVLDWDGTKKKIRAYEQGRDHKKVKVESYKLGDLKSGEVKVWRVMSRSWVGWN